MYLLLYTYRAFGWCLHAKQRTGFTTCYAMTKGKFPYLCNAGSKLRRNYGAMSYELCLGLGTYMLEAWEKWRQNAISHMSYHFVARFNISKHSTTAQLSYFSPHCRRSMILMPTAPRATTAILAPPPRQRTLGKVKKWQKFVELHRSRMPLTRLL